MAALGWLAWQGRPPAVPRIVAGQRVDPHGEVPTGAGHRPGRITEQRSFASNSHMDEGKTLLDTTFGPAGQKLYDGIVSQWELTNAELRLLADAAAEADLIADMEADWIAHGKPMTTQGSRPGMLVAHPTIGELRQHRNTLRQLIGALKLPHPNDERVSGDDDRVRPMSRADSAKKAANARWHPERKAK